MRKTVVISLIGALLMSGCATTRSKLKVRPVSAQSGAKTDRQNVDFETFKKRADALYKKGEYSKAFAKYQVLYLGLPKDHELRNAVTLSLADSAIGLGAQKPALMAEAARIYQKLARAYKGKTEQPCKIRAGLYLTKQFGDIQTLVQACPNDARIWNAYGQSLDKKQEWLLALDAYMEALKVSYKTGANRAAVLNNMGMSLLMQGRHAEALKKFDEAIDLRPSARIYKNNQRLAYMITGQTKAALSGLKDDQMADIYNDAGYIAAKSGRKDAARRLYQKAIDISPVYFQKAVLNLQALNTQSTIKPSPNRVQNPEPKVRPEPKAIKEKTRLAHIPVPSLKPRIYKKAPALQTPVLDVQTARVTPVTVNPNQLAQNP